MTFVKSNRQGKRVTTAKAIGRLGPRYGTPVKCVLATIAAWVTASLAGEPAGGAWRDAARALGKSKLFVSAHLA